MRNIILSFFTVSLLWASACTTSAEQLKAETDASLVKILSTLKFEKEIDKLPLYIRFFTVRSHGECDGAPETCPGTTLYISVSSYDEYPDQKLYRTSEAASWDYVRLVKHASAESNEEYSIFEFEKRELINPKEVKRCFLKVNLNSAEIEEIK
jgi:hypothetical protein